nr:endochitinase A-like [Onthophagus taurus]XP_022899961.1 endochitinase A-like [Onthophagus taurus]
MQGSTSTLWPYLLITISCFLTVSSVDIKSTSTTTPRLTSAITINTTTPTPNKFLPPPTNITDVLDVRTPPKIKQMMKKVEQKHHQSIENSHPGVAEPVDEESILDDSKKMNFYKLESKSTTDSGLSTWILLSGQTSSTQKPIKTPNNKNETKNVAIANPNRGAKPGFKKKPTNNQLVTSTSTSTTTQKIVGIKDVEKSTTQKSVSTLGEIVTKINKIKGSITKHNKTEPAIKESSTIKVTSSVSEKINNSTQKVISNEKVLTLKENNASTTESATTISTLNLKPELKDGELELPSSTPNTKKNRRPSQKKKKNKNRTRRPNAEEKIDGNKENKTKIATKEKPISTQIYNYLAREVMPTVGVGLVGLVVTAGLASYFLYPFGTLRRSYDIDRKDKGNNYYYENEYSGGVPEEEAIGKVIAGMPFYDYNKNNYQNENIQNRQNYQPASKQTHSNRYRYSDNYYNPQVTVEKVQLDPLKDYKHDGNYLQESYQTNEVHKNEPITFNKDVIAKNVEATYSTSDQQYVVGNIPKEIQVQEVTPVAVPEHGPRSLKLRRKREIFKKNGVKIGKNLRFRKKVGKL